VPERALVGTVAIKTTSDSLRSNEAVRAILEQAAAAAWVENLRMARTRGKPRSRHFKMTAPICTTSSSSEVAGF
jgi:hypothetical protein